MTGEKIKVKRVQIYLVAINNSQMDFGCLLSVYFIYVCVYMCGVTVYFAPLLCQKAQRT